MKETAYEQYSARVKTALELGIKKHVIARELKNEIQSIQKRAIVKCGELRLNSSPYPAREVLRASHECITAIERIIKELTAESVTKG